MVRMITHPPSFGSLIGDPVFRAYMKRVPRLPPSLTHGQPWAVYGLTIDDRWRGGKFATYADAWRVAVSMHKQPDKYQDVSVVSRRMLFDPPASLLHLIDYPFAWCPRCRRPTLYLRYPRHHAVQVMTTDDPIRCFYCGIRRSFVT